MADKAFRCGAPEIERVFEAKSKKGGGRYCAVCLRSESERRLVDNGTFKKFILAVHLEYHWKPLQEPSICFMCERLAVNAYKFYRATQFASSINKIFMEIQLKEDSVRKHIFHKANFKKMLMQLNLDDEKILPSQWEAELKIIQRRSGLVRGETTVRDYVGEKPDDIDNAVSIEIDQFLPTPIPKETSAKMMRGRPNNDGSKKNPNEGLARMKEALPPEIQIKPLNPEETLIVETISDSDDIQSSSKESPKRPITNAESPKRPITKGPTLVPIERLLQPKEVKNAINIQQNNTNNLLQNITNNLQPNITNTRQQNGTKLVPIERLLQPKEVKNTINIQQNITNNLQPNITNAVQQNITNTLQQNGTKLVPIERLLQPKEVKNTINIQQNNTNNLQQNITNALQQNITNNLQPNITNALQQNITNNQQQNITNTLQQNITNNLQPNITNALQQNITNNQQQNITNALQQNNTNNLQQNITNALQQNITNNLQQNITNSQQQNITNALQQNITNNQQHNITNNLQQNGNKTISLQQNANKIETQFILHSVVFTGNGGLNVPTITGQVINGQLYTNNVILQNGVLQPLVPVLPPQNNVNIQKRKCDIATPSGNMATQSKRKVLPILPKPTENRTIDWEDKIPMDVISFMDAVDPTSITKYFNKTNQNIVAIVSNKGASKSVAQKQNTSSSDVIDLC